MPLEPCPAFSGKKRLHRDYAVCQKYYTLSQGKNSVGENTGNLEILYKHREFGLLKF